MPFPWPLAGLPPLPLLVLGIALVATQAVTFRAGSARRSAAQPLVFLAALLLPPLPAAALVAATHLLGRGLVARAFPALASSAAGGTLLAGAAVQAARALAVSAGAGLLPAGIDGAARLGVLAGIDLGVAFVLWTAQRQLRDRRRVSPSDAGPLFGGEALGDLVGALAFTAGPSAAAAALAGVAAIALGLLGIQAERGRIAERHFSGFLGTGDLVTASDVEAFLESFGRAVRRVVRYDRIELLLFDEEGRPAGAWQLVGEEVEPLAAATEATTGSPIDLAVDTADSFIPTALASPDPLPPNLSVPVVDGQRVLGTLHLLAPGLPELVGRPRKLLETLLRQATAVLRALRLQRLATTDPLTGLAIRRLFDLRLAEAVARVRSGGPPASLVLVDIDHFKSVNDRYGHPAGDQVLRALGLLLRESLRGRDLAARLGGEEFALLLPGTAADGAVLAADRIRRRLESTPVPLDGGPLTVTASFGTTPIRPESTPAEAVEAADRALYAAKHGGRNRVVSAESIPAAPARKTGAPSAQLG